MPNCALIEIGIFDMCPALCLSTKLQAIKTYGIDSSSSSNIERGFNGRSSVSFNKPLSLTVSFI